MNHPSAAPAVTTGQQQHGKASRPEKRTKFFARYDGPYTEESVSLGNHAVRKILERHFEYMSRNLFFISAFGRFLLALDRQEDVVKAEEIARTTIANGITWMDRKIEMARELIRQNSVSEQPLFGNMKAQTVPITTPGAKMYVKLLTMADMFYSLNSLLWLDGVIDDKTKFANESEARKVIQGVVRGVAGQFGYVLNLTRNKDANEAAKAGVDSQADLDAETAEAEAAVDVAGSQGMAESVSDAASTGEGGAADKPAKGTRAKKKAASEAQA